MIPMTLPDIIDRYCIAVLKAERTKEDFYLELNMLGSEFDRYCFKDRDKINYFIDKIMIIHRAIWDLEADIRNCCDKNLGLEEVGRRALIIRDHNQERQVIKNEMIDYFGQGFKDCKVNYSKRL